MRKEDTKIFYSDELNDDFGKFHISPNVYSGKKKAVIERKGLYNFCSNIFIYILFPLLILFGLLTGFRIKGRKNIKKVDKKQGYFIFSNHAGIYDVALNYTLCLPKRMDTVGYSGALDGWLLRRIVPFLGFIPLPVDFHDIPKFKHALKYYIVDKKQVVCIYPEAHLWPYYTGVRNFRRQSFRYPVELGAPIVPVFFARRKRKGLWRLFKRPRVTAIIGQPIYPDLTLSRVEATHKLGDECYEALLKASKSIEQEEYWHYEYRPNK